MSTLQTMLNTNLAFSQMLYFNISSDDDDVASTGHSKSSTTIDVIAQQLKFIACLKIMMEELSTLATGFEVDGGLLRYQVR
jgi:hypothetical protein